MSWIQVVRLGEKTHTSSAVFPLSLWPNSPASGHEEGSAVRIRGHGGVATVIILAVDGLNALPQDWPQDDDGDEEHTQVRHGDE